MKTRKAILYGILIWGWIIAAYSASSFVTLLDNPVLQEYLALIVSVFLFVTLGSWLYFRKRPEDSGIKVALIMAATTVVLDAIFTVPVFVIPAGGSYQEFFTAPGFWMIISEYVLVVLLTKKVYQLKPQA